jgi:hypothetical protein
MGVEDHLVECHVLKDISRSRGESVDECLCTLKLDLEGLILAGVWEAI